ncbi:Ribonucleases P/MRP protein subunit pop1 [Spiromyces aspiralis]|uniref:Ribonucleases P/MRP protein subunit pop1 n=1 Tax=Spiromyces aspiralis TaxID=68401 RepID=A0ACC1HB10_9FUNG|nr:Ribonucleases P/MRP protein subunit pop1 [Spiromyces aspiralis]
MPAGAIIDIEVNDPRLAFPQKITWPGILPPLPVAGGGTSLNGEWSPNAASFPSPKDSIWDREHCKSILEAHLTEQQLSERRGNQLVPGQKLQFGANDVGVPVMLVQRSPDMVSGSELSVQSGAIAAGEHGKKAARRAEHLANG